MDKLEILFDVVFFCEFESFCVWLMINIWYIMVKYMSVFMCIILIEVCKEWLL